MLTKGLFCFVLFVCVCVYVAQSERKKKMTNYVKAINTPVPPAFSFPRCPTVTFFFPGGFWGGVCVSDTAYVLFDDVDDGDMSERREKGTKDELDDEECDKKGKRWNENEKKKEGITFTQTHHENVLPLTD